MIQRYSRAQMRDIWSEQRKLEIWLQIELLASEALSREGLVPPVDFAQMKARASFNLDRCKELERTLNHDVIAFTTNVAENIGAPASRWLHFGLTSSDVVDTGFAVQMVQSADLLIEDVRELRVVIAKRARQHQFTPMIGRSHGIHAEPTTFGLKLAGHYAEFARNRGRLVAARAEIATCAISGAVGTFAHIDPRVEARVAERLGLTPEPISTQVIPRDRHAAFFCALAVTAGGIERLATEIRHLQRSEVREAEEFFHAGQKGSSAMPHKRNPVLSENLTGLARLVRGAVVPTLENIALWHERDISHSSVERVIAPDTTIALDFALDRMAGLIERLVVYPERMRANLESLGGMVHSGEVLLALARAGLSREAAYAIVQRNAMQTWTALGRPGAQDFRTNLEADPELAGRLSPEALNAAMDPAPHLRQLDTIFTRMFGEPGPAAAPA